MKLPRLHRRPLRVELAFLTRTTELFIYRPEYLLLPYISTNFHLHRSQDLLVEGLVTSNFPQNTKFLSLYSGFVWSYTYAPSPLFGASIFRIITDYSVR